MLGDRSARYDHPTILFTFNYMRVAEQLTEHWSNNKAIDLLLPVLLDELSEIVSIKNADQTVIFINRVGFELFKLENEEVIGHKCYELNGHEKFCDNCPASTAKLTKKSVRAEAYFESVDKWFEINAMPVCDKHGEVIYIIEIYRDLTPIKQLQEQLQFYEARTSLAP